MATLKQMLKIGGSLEGAEKIARDLIRKYGKTYLLDLELLLSSQGKTEEAFEVNKQALKANPNDCRALYNHGWHLIRNGDLLNGYKHLGFGRMVGIYAKPYINTKKPIWQGEDLKGKAVLFHCECGLGDEIIQVRFVKNLIEKGAKVVIGCSESLMSLFNRIPGISAVIDKECSWKAYHDYWMPSMNAVDILGITYEALPGDSYLTAAPEYVQKWKNIIKDLSVGRQEKLKIGIRWAGNACYEEELWRTLPAKELIEAINSPDVRIYSLQRDDSLINLPDHVIDLSTLLETWEDTAGAMANLDLVISSCTSIPHLAGALGVPTWVIVPTLNYYIWALPGDKTPWYNSVRIFRQKAFQDWAKPLTEVRKALENMNGA